MNRLAALLVAEESKEGPKTHGAATALRACEKLRRSLSKLTGPAGFGALLARALFLSQAEIPWLSLVTISPQGEVLGWTDATSGLSEKEAAEGAKKLVAQFLNLLEIFIGADLTIRLVQEVWPKAKLNIFKSRPGEL